MSDLRPEFPRLRVTLDSDVLIDVFDADAADPVRRTWSLRLFELHSQDHCVLGVSRELLEREWGRRSSELAAARIQALDADGVDEAPMGGRIGAATIGRSVFVDGDVEATLRRIIGIAEPGDDLDRYLRKVSDVDELLSHHMARRDIFVTGDRRLLNATRREAFRVELSLVVMTAEEAVDAVERRQYLREP